MESQPGIRFELMDWDQILDLQWNLNMTPMSYEKDFGSGSNNNTENLNQKGILQMMWGLIHQLSNLIRDTITFSPFVHRRTMAFSPPQFQESCLTSRIYAQKGHSLREPRRTLVLSPFGKKRAVRWSNLVVLPSPLIGQQGITCLCINQSLGSRNGPPCLVQ